MKLPNKFTFSIAGFDNSLYRAQLDVKRDEVGVYYRVEDMMTLGHVGAFEVIDMERQIRVGAWVIRDQPNPNNNEEALTFLEEES